MSKPPCPLWIQRELATAGLDKIGALYPKQTKAELTALGLIQWSRLCLRYNARILTSPPPAEAKRGARPGLRRLNVSPGGPFFLFLDTDLTPDERNEAIAAEFRAIARELAPPPPEPAAPEPNDDQGEPAAEPDDDQGEGLGEAW